MSEGINLFNKSISDSLIMNKKYLFRHPSYLAAFSKIIRNIKKQSEKRDILADTEGLIVPPIFILSVTNNCNLNCTGCYACAQKRNQSSEMSIEDIRRIVGEAIELGVSIILIAGGEPLMKQGILEIPKMHSDTLFVLFTNGLLMGNDIQSEIKHTKNLIPVLSIEGDMAATDARRGKGVYESIIAKMAELAQKDIMFGSSITLTSENYSSIIKSGYLEWLEGSGCAVSFLIEYVPQSENDPLVLEPEQKLDLADQEIKLSAKHYMLVVALPGDEEKYGGCLAAGRGFLHISSEGSLEACPFAPYSDTNIKNMPLKQALHSKLMAEIRSNHNELTEARGGCALNENREWVQSLMSGK